jgi:hypothetical protein
MEVSNNGNACNNKIIVKYVSTPTLQQQKSIQRETYGLNFNDNYDEA